MFPTTSPLPIPYQGYLPNYLVDAIAFRKKAYLSQQVGDVNQQPQTWYSNLQDYYNILWICTQLMNHRSSSQRK